MNVKENNSISKTDINLAVNYMVIETVLRLMGIKELVYSEHPAIEVIIQEAKDYSLSDRFTSYLNGDDDAKLLYDRLIKEMSKLFDLSEDILTGERQINLGIEVTLKDKILSKISRMSMNDLEKYYENACKKVCLKLIGTETNVENLFGIVDGLIYDTEIPSIGIMKGEELRKHFDAEYKRVWLELLGTDHGKIDSAFLRNYLSDNHLLKEYSKYSIFDYVIMNSIGSSQTYSKFGVDFLINSLYYNPLGLNWIAIFNQLFKSFYEIKKSGDKAKNYLLKLYDYFTCINFQEYLLFDDEKPDEIIPDSKLEPFAKDNRDKFIVGASDDYCLITWHENVYSLQSLIYNIIVHISPIYRESCKRHLSSSSIKTYTINNDKFNCIILPYPLVLNAEESELILLINSLHGLYSEIIKYYIELPEGRIKADDDFVLYSDEIKRCKDDKDNKDELTKQNENAKKDIQAWAKQYALQLFRQKTERTRNDNYIPNRDNIKDDIDRWFAKYTKLMPIKKAREKIIAHKMENEYKEIMKTKEKEIKVEFLKSFTQWLFFMEYTSKKPYIITKYPDYTKRISLKSPEEEEEDRKKAERARIAKAENAKKKKAEEIAKAKEQAKSKQRQISKK